MTNAYHFFTEAPFYIAHHLWIAVVGFVVLASAVVLVDFSGGRGRS